MNSPPTTRRIFPSLPARTAVLVAVVAAGSAACSTAGGAGAGAGGGGGGAPAVPDGGADSAGDDTPPPPAWPGGVVDLPLSGCSPFRTARVALGGHSFDLIVDTGSTTTVVAGKSCVECTSAGVDALYTPGPDATDQDQQAKGSYSGGRVSWAGEIYAESVSAEGFPHPVMMRLASVQTEQGFFFPTCSGVPHGIVGLGPKAFALPNTDGYVDQLVSAGMPDTFSFRLCERGGHMWLGGFDPAFTTAAPSYTPMTPSDASHPAYNVEISALEVGGQPLGAPATSYGRAYVDTAGPLLGMPDAVFAALTAAIAASPAAAAVLPGGAGWFASPANCTALAKTAAELDAILPPLAIVFGAPGSAVRIEMPATRSYLVQSPDGSVWCPGIQNAGSFSLKGYAFGVGASVLRSHVVIFDRATNRLGFAAAKACP